MNVWTHLSFVDEFDERSLQDFDLIVRFVEEADHKMEKVGFSEIRRRLSGEFDPANATAENKKKKKKTSFTR